MAAQKQVLVTYLERKKVVKIPPHSGSDIDFLSQEFSQVFGVESSSSVTFQRFDSTWDEYVDLESDCELYSKDKINAVLGSTPGRASVSSEVSHVCRL